MAFRYRPSDKFTIFMDFVTDSEIRATNITTTCSIVVVLCTVGINCEVELQKTFWKNSAQKYSTIVKTFPFFRKSLTKTVFWMIQKWHREYIKVFVHFTQVNNDSNG